MKDQIVLAYQVIIRITFILDTWGPLRRDSCKCELKEGGEPQGFECL